VVSFLSAGRWAILRRSFRPLSALLKYNFELALSAAT
jgi:hypothetical protein